MKHLLRSACSGDIASGALRVALPVGTILNLINQGPAVTAGSDVSWIHVALNYLVPYCVASYSGARVRRRQERGE